MQTYHLLTILICLLLINLVSSLDKQRDCKCRIQTNRRIVGGSDLSDLLCRGIFEENLLHCSTNPLSIPRAQC